MKNTECHLCGASTASHTPGSEACQDQQRINADNLAQDGGCHWCGSRGGHRDGCPRHKKDTITSRKEGRTTIITTECGYCGAKSENSHTPANSRGEGGGASWAGANHTFGCPRHVQVRMATSRG